jgi:hypothetical protein
VPRAFLVKNSYCVWLELSLEGQRFFSWMRYAIFVIYLPVAVSDDIIRRLLGLNIFGLVMICGLRVTIYSVDYATDELIGKTIRQ